ncbi:MAG TPA: FtsW/RodA/SpoVE family cell cycle protein, partial [Anaerolineae bacterium]
KKRLGEVTAGLVPFAVVMGVVGGLIVMEKSFSVTLIILITGITIFFLGGGDVKQLLVTGVIAAVVLLLLVYKFHYGITRIQDWWQAVTDPSNLPYTMAQVRAIIQRGGGIGTRPENWINKDLVPLLWSDYLFANIAADFKFVGAVAVVVLFAGLGYRGLSIALSARDQFGALAGIGITTWILTQAVIHIGTSVALIPPTGIPLPFMSYGGSAMLACMAGVGLLLSISRGSPEKKSGNEDILIRRGDRGPRLSDSGRGAGTDPPVRRTKEPGPQKTGGRTSGKTADRQRKPASGASGRWHPRTREEEYTIDNDWRSRRGNWQIPSRPRPASKNGSTRH